ncbi:MAG: CBS domain-containing protein [Acidobacteriota bacterium]|nr:CBS domain-containing protein [Acidobacteriota bacterium]
MRVHEIMTKRVQTVAHTENAEAAWNLMRWKRIHHLVVTGDGGEVVGVVSARDLGGRDRDEIRRMRPIGAMMTAYAVKATPDMPVRQAANVMRGWNIGCLPVIEPDGTLAGIVTVSDLLRLLAEQVPSPSKQAKPAARKAAGKKFVNIGKAAKTGAAKKSRPKRA